MIRFNDGISHIDHKLVVQIVDTREFQHDVIRVRKIVNDDGFVLVLKNATRARKITICNRRNSTEVVISFIHAPALTAKTLGHVPLTERTIALENGNQVNRVIPEMRKYLHGGAAVEKTEKIQATEKRNRMNDDKVYAMYIAKFKRLADYPHAEPIYDLTLEDGERQLSKVVRIKGMEKAMTDQSDKFLYLENTAGEYAVVSSRFFNWKFELEA